MGVSWGLVLGWMALIFILSAQPGVQSAALSGGITEFIKGTVEVLAPGADINIELLSHFVRKNAHFFAYLLLGVLALNALRRSGRKGWKSAAAAFAICVLYSISDEFHQLYVPGRSGQISDVILDSFGALTGIGVYLLAAKQKIKKRRKA
jgi:VanZ family protein